MEGGGLGGNDVHEWAALEPGKDGGVDFLGPVGFTHGHACTWSAESFVRGGGDEIGVGDGRFVQVGGDEARDVSDVGHQQGAGLFGDFGEGGPLPETRISRGAGDDEFGFVFEGGLADFSHVDAFGLGIERVMDGFEPFAGQIDIFAVGEVSAVVEVESHDRVARLQGGEQDGLVGLRTGMRLDVDVVAMEELLGAIAGEIFDDIDELAAAVVTLAGVAFGVLVGQRRGGGGENGRRNVVLRSDQLKGLFLTLSFVADGLPESGVELSEGIHVLSPLHTWNGKRHYRGKRMAGSMNEGGEFRWVCQFFYHGEQRAFGILIGVVESHGAGTAIFRIEKIIHVAGALRLVALHVAGEVEEFRFDVVSDRFAAGGEPICRRKRSERYQHIGGRARWRGGLFSASGRRPALRGREGRLIPRFREVW